jgi:hypothetical protein
MTSIPVRHARRTIHPAAVLLLISAGCTMLHAASEVRFQLVRDALILIPVTANNAAPVYFVLDTGADTTTVDSTLAKRLGLAVLGSAQQTSLTGSESVTVSRLQNLTVAGVRVDALPVLVEDLEVLRQIDKRIAGIVGQDFLSRFNYLLDYERRVVRIEDGDEMWAAMDGDELPLQAAGHRMMVAAEAEAKGSAKVRLILDSGANGLVLMGPASSAVHCDIGHLGMEMSAVGETAMRFGRIDRLTVAAEDLRDLPVALLVEAPVAQVGDGLLPTVLFRTVYVNNARGFVMLNPRVRKVAAVKAATLVARVDGR